MKKFILGLIAGLSLGIAFTCYAYVGRTIWVNGAERAMGTTTVPVVITIQ